MKKMFVKMTKSIYKYASIVRGTCLVLVVSTIFGSMFFAYKSFGKYYQEFNDKNNAGLATPVAQYHRNHLTRVSRNGKEFPYAIKDGTDSFIFENLQPKDCIYYYFYISNYDQNNNLNEVDLKVTVDTRVYLQRLKDTGSTRYFVTGNEYVVGSDFTDDTSMKDANLEILYSQNNSITSMVNIEDDYIIMPRVGGRQDKLTEEQYQDGNTLIISESSTLGVIHRTGFYFHAGSDKKQKSYLIRITLPEQYQGSEQYIGGRLFLDVVVSAKQVQM